MYDVICYIFACFAYFEHIVNYYTVCDMEFQSEFCFCAVFRL